MIVSCSSRSRSHVTSARRSRSLRVSRRMTGSLRARRTASRQATRFVLSALLGPLAHPKPALPGGRKASPLDRTVRRWPGHASSYEPPKLRENPAGHDHFAEVVNRLEANGIGGGPRKIQKSQVRVRRPHNNEGGRQGGRRCRRQDARIDHFVAGDEPSITTAPHRRRCSSRATASVQRR